MRNLPAEAEQLLNNRLYQDTFQAIREDVIKRLRGVSTQDVETVLEITRELQMIDSFAAKIESHLTGSRIAEYNQQALELRNAK